MFAKITITVPNKADVGAAANNGNKIEIFENCVPFPDCISEIKNT